MAEVDVQSPYTPGQLPTVLVGREQQMNDVRAHVGQLATFGRVAGPPFLFCAPRGIGKTSLMRAAQSEAESVGFVTAWVSARDDSSLDHDVATAIAQGVARAGLDVGEGVERWRDRLASFSVQVGVPGVAKVGAEFEQPSKPAVGAPSIEELLASSARLVKEQGRPGLVLLIDELQAGRSTDLRSWAYAAQHLQAESTPTPVALLGAGLPSLPETLMEAATFAERFSFTVLDRLTPAATRLALQGPAEALGVRWQPEALERAVMSSAGYPFMVQVLGHETWLATAPQAGSEIAVTDVETGITSSVDRLQPMFRGRWSKATAAERRFMAAMAAGGEVVDRATIAQTLGKSTRALSMARAALIDKGLIEPVERGRLQFTTPGFAEFVREQTPK